jgi:DNA-binding MarR family transcriptional regulator
MSDTGEQKLGDLPPSAKLVFWVIDQEEPVTQKRIVEETLLPKRTVRYGIDRLIDINIITKQRNPYDARQLLYTIAHTDSSTGTS